MRIFSYFHNEWKADSGREDKNVRIITNIENDDAIQIVFLSKSLPKIQSTSGVTTTNRHGKAADVMIIRMEVVRTRNLITAQIFSLSK